jgi:hypothetical protein
VTHEMLDLLPVFLGVVGIAGFFRMTYVAWKIHRNNAGARGACLPGIGEEPGSSRPARSLKRVLPGTLRFAFLPCQTDRTAPGSRPRAEGGRWWIPAEPDTARSHAPGGCACIYIYEIDSCNCECFGDEPSGSVAVLGLGNKIDVSVSAIPLGQVAAQFDRLLARNVLVPAARVKKKVRRRLRGVRVAAAVKALALNTQGRPRRMKSRRSKRRATR